MRKIRQFTAVVEYKDAHGKTHEDYSTATAVAVSYVLQVLKLQDFELRIVGA